MLVTPTTSTPVQDNISLILPLVFYLASTHLGRDTQHQIQWSVEGPRGSKTLTVGAPGRDSLRVGNTLPLSSRWIIFSNLFGPGRCSALEVSGSCPPTAATTWYSSPGSTTTTTAAGSPGGGELDDDFPPWRKRNTWVCPTTLLAEGGGDGATMARQETASHRLSDQSESTTPTSLWETCRASSSHLRQ
jgi:hypothetical protein